MSSKGGDTRQEGREPSNIDNFMCVPRSEQPAGQPTYVLDTSIGHDKDTNTTRNSFWWIDIDSCWVDSHRDAENDGEGNGESNGEGNGESNGE